MITCFIQELEREGKSPLTIQAYTKDIQQFSDWLFETIGYKTDAITETDLREYRQFLNLLKKLKVTSINRKIKSVVRYQRFLYKQGICKEEVDLRKVLQRNNIEYDFDVKVVEKQDLYRLKRTIEAEGNRRDILVYYLLFGTGVRCSELVAIEIDDIHITERNGKNNYSYIMIRNGKGSKVRKVNLNSEVVNAIKAYLEGRPAVSSNKLLQGQRGTLTRLAINKLLEKYSKKAQLDYIVSPHMARHTFCSNLIKEGKVDPKTVAILSGHSSVDTLYRFYVNSSAEDKQRAVDNLFV
ncbi:tyrosine-type recombinase/integrase [Heyndrickxia sporothermodurans]|uniref:tyrosine-type recombinase/integrase n=1 Tax=Heyndrickxia sporothermodurans TaxID=46224 RepID=UPI002E1A35AF|nr:tyrosine-type recombinase/integrase [Heyndrickxia sporothermodurans]MED3652688.1 tyrosine-type recombinase/integrase [Heyndrickxia sporothermodurans]MED3700159.1 tyrosine-type recombinase/integrase [Heyndrickxia sporothermodurans]MED3779723.1 tyrosine-type recombinase/integrase [Heyndrickxia sporothermodurans]